MLPHYPFELFGHPFGFIGEKQDIIVKLPYIDLGVYFPIVFVKLFMFEVYWWDEFQDGLDEWLTFETSDRISFSSSQWYRYC